MNIRDAIAAGLDSVADATTVITTDVSEVDAYGKHAHYAGRTIGYRQGFKHGIITGAAIVVVGSVLGITMAIVSDVLESNKEK